MEPEAAKHASAAAEEAVTQTRLTARDLARLLGRTAEALERSAMLAEDHAERRERADPMMAAAEERRAAVRAREAAERARARAGEWLELLNQRRI
jgi:hypothetical protein